MEVEKQNVRQLINNLAIGEAVAFPISRMDYVLSCRTRLQKTEFKKFSSKQNTKAGVITITRSKPG